MHLLIHNKCLCINSNFFNSSLELISKHVFSNLADESSFLSKTIQHSKNIAWGSAWIGLHNRVALCAGTILCEVDQKFTQCSHIIASIAH